VKLTPTEYRLLDLLDRVVGNVMRLDWCKPRAQRTAKRMSAKGLIRKRMLANGIVKATALGKRSYSYGKR
jgi:hypothetical protein